MLAYSYDLRWQANLSKFLESISFVTKSADILISVDCFIRKTTDTLDPMYAKAMLTLVIPAGSSLVILAANLLIKFFKPSYNLISNYCTSMIVFIFLCLPSITSQTISMINCQEIFNDGDTYLFADLSLKCWQGDHKLYSSIFTIPVLVLIVFGLPILVVFFMWRQKRQIEDMQKYSFLHIGLYPTTYFWEIVIHFRQVLMIFFNSYFCYLTPIYKVSLILISCRDAWG